MGKPLRVLMVEDSEDDVLLTIRALRKGDYEPEYERVETAGAMRGALREKPWDVILCDYQMPQFNGHAAIALLKETGIDIPLIIVSGAIGEETAVECMLSGAHDYLIKNNLSRLAPAIERELREAESRRQHKQAEEALIKSQHLLAETEKIGKVGGWEFNIDTGKQTWTEEIYRIHELDLTFEPTVEKGVHFYTPASRPIIKQAVQHTLEHGEPFDVELEIITAKGNLRSVHAIGKADLDHRRVYGFFQDITDRKRMEKQLQDTLQHLRKALSTTIQVMVSAVETRDPYTAGHQIRSADLARAIAAEMGFAQDRIEGIYVAGSIHDIGKLSVPAEILSKPTKLTNIEFSLIKAHSHGGYEILKDVESPWPLAEIVYQHHERMDGSGYPRKLKGNDILMEARILGVADVVESMSSHRPYCPAQGIDVALEEISKNRGVLYDPEVVNACLKLFHEKGYRLTISEAFLRDDSLTRH